MQRRWSCFPHPSILYTLWITCDPNFLSCFECYSLGTRNHVNLCYRPRPAACAILLATYSLGVRKIQLLAKVDRIFRRGPWKRFSHVNHIPFEVRPNVVLLHSSTNSGPWCFAWWAFHPILWTLSDPIKPLFQRFQRLVTSKWPPNISPCISISLLSSR